MQDLKGVVSFGEIGFALLGSTAWNYQFYGEMVSDLKIKAEELRPGELVVMQCLLDILQSEAIPEEDIARSSLLTELRKMHDTSSPAATPPTTVHRGACPEVAGHTFLKNMCDARWPAVQR